MNAIQKQFLSCPASFHFVAVSVTKPVVVPCHTDFIPDRKEDGLLNGVCTSV
jgi:hypothetical protein